MVLICFIFLATIPFIDDSFFINRLSDHKIEARRYFFVKLDRIFQVLRKS
jgi:hypothetical protein